MDTNSNNPLSSQILNRIKSSRKEMVWTPNDFYDLGNREAIKKALQRLVSDNLLRRIDRGLYDKPKKNKLTDTEYVSDYRSVINAVSRRDQVSILIDGITAA